MVDTQWIFRNKLEEHDTITRNKARLVAQGYSQEEVFVEQPLEFKDIHHPDYGYSRGTVLDGESCMEDQMGRLKVHTYVGLHIVDEDLKEEILGLRDELPGVSNFKRSEERDEERFSRWKTKHSPELSRGATRNVASFPQPLSSRSQIDVFQEDDSCHGFFRHRISSPPAADANGLASIPDLKNLASSRLQDLKQHIDRSHTEILKDCDSARSRLHKRFKIQTQACQQMLDEADKGYKKKTQRTIESREAMMASYAEFIVDAQASASRGMSMA
ncbi:uncharacterized protein LOC126795570 [Argentina anserina]|uniref:uncharacterized protein LOC126795570 n=1 Tax=Argentina anserina TaxID=57926 RepID=UPI0021762B5D|nr:uncharacterized protein LOC126795570 [Potentilla anserina]